LNSQTLTERGGYADAHVSINEDDALLTDHEVYR
jgi:hypothetical protein